MARLAAAIAAAAALGLLPALAAAADNPLEHPARLVKLPDGRRINLRCAGHGSPTVVFDGGYLANSGAWFKVQPQVATLTRACSYDRAGSGFSDPGPLPRDGQAVARDLDQTLRAAGVGGPYILVGHSAGALYARLFADLRPKDVVGMVLVDPTVEHQDQRFDALFGRGAGGAGR